jgi:hypothetical protein
MTLPARIKRSRTFNIRLSDEDRAILAEVAATREASSAEVVRSLVREELWRQHAARAEARFCAELERVIP